MTTNDHTTTADKVQEVIDFLTEHAKTEESGDYEIGYANAIQNCLSLLDGIVPTPPTLAGELRKYAENILAGGSASDVKRQLILFADRVETLEKERDTAADALKVGAEVTTDALDRRDELEADLAAARLVVDEQVSEIEWLRSHKLPEGWRLADHPEYGRGIATGTVPDCDGDICFIHSADDLPLGHDWYFCYPSELTFCDETPAPEETPESEEDFMENIEKALDDHYGPSPKPEHIDPKTCGRYTWYLIDTYGQERHGIRIDPTDPASEWCIIAEFGEIAFRADPEVTVLRTLTPEEMDAK